MNSRRLQAWRRPCPTGRGRAAFTLLELLVVIAIIGALAALGLPAFKSWNRSHATTAANRQLLDDLGNARRRAIASRSTVYVVFAPTNLFAINPAAWNPSDRQTFTNLLEGQYASYALFATRTVGDQPGATNAQYTSAWKTLPDGTFIALSKFMPYSMNPNPADGVYGFHRGNFPFPNSDGPVVVSLPAIGFDYQGRLITGQDEVIPLTRGSVWPARDSVSGQLTLAPPDVVETPPGNAANSLSNHIRVDWLTGRARLETWTMP